MLDLPSIMQRSLLLALLLPGWALAVPVPDEKKPQYIVGYGDLMYEEARKRKAAKAKLEIPVMVKGFKRGWLARTKAGTVTFTKLGVVSSANNEFNGVLLSVSTSKLKSMDNDYPLHTRVKLDKTKIESMDKNTKLPAGGEIWVYEVKKRHLGEPAGEYPILQSDVDVFLSGCIEVSGQFKIKDFADRCVTTTEKWSVNWANDRQRPLSGKIFQANNKEVDKLLKKLKGDLYEGVRAR